jgi:hypothetical protein
MYCPSCGKSVKDGLRYCNHCGERLERETDDSGSPGKMLKEILETLFWMAVIGLGILIGLVSVLLNKNIDPMIVGIIVVAYLMTLFGICFTLSRQVPKLIDARLKGEQKRDHVPDLELPSARAGQLDAYREPATVTDVTTRTLDEELVERKR